MINLLTFSYKLVRADSFYIFYFFLAIGMGVIVGFFASRAFERRVWRVCMFSGVLILHVITALVILSPEDAYKEMILRKKNTMNTLTNCKISAFMLNKELMGAKMPGPVLTEQPATFPLSTGQKEVYLKIKCNDVIY